MENVAVKQTGAVPKSIANPRITDQDVFNLYRTFGRVESLSALRREKIVLIPEDTQISILFDNRFHSIRDGRGVGPVHDLAMFGTGKVQLEILVQHQIFDTPRFMSEWGTPLDLMALLGREEVRIKMPEILSDAKMTELRINGRTLLHDIARTLSDADRKTLYEHLKPPLLAALSGKGESVVRILWNGGDKAFRRRIYLNNPVWNWFDNPPSQRKP